MNIINSFFRKPARVRLEIEPKRLAALMEAGQINATNFRCLDLSSKRIVWGWLLSQAITKAQAKNKMLTH